MPRPIRGAALPVEEKQMDETRKRLGSAGAEALTLGILTLVFGVSVGVLNIVNGARLLHQRKRLN